MKKTFSVLIMLVMIMFTACSNVKEVPNGTYIADEGKATIIVKNANEIMITGPKEISAAFTGKYIVEGDKLILTLAEQEDYIFLIEDKALVLESGEWLENWVEQGTTFHLSGEKSSPVPNIDLSAMSQIDVVHIISGQESTTTLDSPEEIKKVADWLNNLNMELKDFDDTNSPGNKDGGEIFVFKTNDKDLFSYVKNEEISSYILYTEKWYLISNPSDPI